MGSMQAAGASKKRPTFKLKMKDVKEALERQRQAAQAEAPHAATVSTAARAPAPQPPAVTQPNAPAWLTDVFEGASGPTMSSGSVSTAEENEDAGNKQGAQAPQMKSAARSMQRPPHHPGMPTGLQPVPASALLKVSDPFWGSQLAPTARRTAAWPPAVAPKLPVLSSLTAARSLTGSGSGFDGVSMPYGKAAALASGHSRLVAAGSKAASTFTHQEMASKDPAARLGPSTSPQPEVEHLRDVLPKRRLLTAAKDMGGLGDGMPRISSASAAAPPAGTDSLSPVAKRLRPGGAGLPAGTPLGAAAATAGEPPRVPLRIPAPPGPPVDDRLLLRLAASPLATTSEAAQPAAALWAESGASAAVEGSGALALSPDLLAAHAAAHRARLQRAQEDLAALTARLQQQQRESTKLLQQAKLQGSLVALAAPPTSALGASSDFLMQAVLRVQETQAALTAQQQQQQRQNSVLLYRAERQKKDLQAALSAATVAAANAAATAKAQAAAAAAAAAGAQPEAELPLELVAQLATQLQEWPLDMLLAGQPEQPVDPLPPWEDFQLMAVRNRAAAAALAVAHSRLPTLMRLPARLFLARYLRGGSMLFALAERTGEQPGQPGQGGWPLYGQDGSLMVALGQGGAPLVPLPAGYAIVTGSERQLDVLPFLRLLLFRMTVQLGPVHRVGAAGGAGALETTTDRHTGLVSWVTQHFGAPWDASGYAVCLPTLWAVLATGIGPAHTKRDKVGYQIGFAGSIYRA